MYIHIPTPSNPARQPTQFPRCTQASAIKCFVKVIAQLQLCRKGHLPHALLIQPEQACAIHTQATVIYRQNLRRIAQAQACNSINRCPPPATIRVHAVKRPSSKLVSTEADSDPKPYVSLHSLGMSRDLAELRAQVAVAVDGCLGAENGISTRQYR